MNTTIIYILAVTAVATLLAIYIFGEAILDLFFECKTIVNCAHEPYLHRWFIIRTKYFGFFVHKFVRSDEDRALHDHPWSFIVLPIWRGYIEHSDREEPCNAGAISLAPARLPVRRRVLPILGLRFRDTTYRHRVELLTDKNGQPKAAWSLFFRFEKVRTWGFWGPDGFIDWNKWWQDNKCE